MDDHGLWLSEFVLVAERILFLFFWGLQLICSFFWSGEGEMVGDRPCVVLICGHCFLLAELS
jgi:hypothetical protein